MSKEKAIKIKKPHQLKLSSMSNHWEHMPPTKSGKHRSQERQRMKKRIIKIAKNKRKNDTTV